VSPPSVAGPDEPYYAPGWQAPRSRTDGLAIASLVTAVVGLGPVGVGLGIAALVRIGRHRTRGRGLAIAGIAVGAVWTLVAIAVAAVAVGTALAARPLPSDVPAPQDAHAIQLVTGNCLDRLRADGELDVVHVVPCAEPHAAQVISQYAFAPDAVWPGQAGADRRVAVGCELSAAESEAGLSPVTWAPTEQSWSREDRTGLCLVHLADDAPITGSLLDGTADVP